jgi:hypothetical protein
MKVLLIFRGENVRASHNDSRRRYTDALLSWNNWKTTLINDLEINNHVVDIAFVTYQSKIIEEIRQIINPKYIELMEQSTQRANFTKVIEFIDIHKNEYDRVVIMRCDFDYRYSITNWPKWNERGIILVNKDVNWPSRKFYADVLFIVDKGYFNFFKAAYYGGVHEDSIHALGRYLYENKIPFYLMYEDYYHMNDHPLHSLSTLEEKPDLNNPYLGAKKLDTKEWNSL